MGLKYSYLTDLSDNDLNSFGTGPFRLLDLKGRRGIHPTSVHSALRLGPHPLNEPKGTVVLWFFALEDLAASFQSGHMATDNPNYDNYAFLSDCPTPNAYADASFFFGWFRCNELRAQFFKGSIHGGKGEGFLPPQKAWVQAVPFNYFEQHRWYQLAVSWDHAAKDLRLYVNGILVGTSDRFNKAFHREPCGETLYAGSPAICHGEIGFYDEILAPDNIADLYRAGAVDYDPEVQRKLRHVFAGEDLEDFTFLPGAGWTKQWDLSLREPAHVEKFYIQGEADSVKPGAHPEGLLVETPDVSFEKQNRHRQVYLWSERMFEGNVYIEFEWQSLKAGGLALLIAQATGMAREDFMADYPRKTSGQMHTVHGQNVRNYHWEFYREMHDVRNDVGTAFSRKNPFQFRNGFGSAPAPFALNTWHKLQYLQKDGSIRGAIDGKILLEIEDHSRVNTGCVLNCGHIAIRCMLHSKMLFRDLRVFTEDLPFSVVARSENFFPEGL